MANRFVFASILPLPIVVTTEWVKEEGTREEKKRFAHAKGTIVYFEKKNSFSIIKYSTAAER